MPDPPAHEDSAFAQQESVYRVWGSLQNPGDLFDQGRREPLIRIQMQHPVGMEGQVLLSPVPLRGIIFKRVGEHCGAGSPGDLDGCIRAARVDQQDFTVKSFQAFQAGGQVRLLIVGQDYHGKTVCPGLRLLSIVRLRRARKLFCFHE